MTLGGFSTSYFQFYLSLFFPVLCRWTAVSQIFQWSFAGGVESAFWFAFIFLPAFVGQPLFRVFGKLLISFAQDAELTPGKDG
jgi:hypothetical protein